MKRMAVKAMLGVVGVLSLVVTTRALGVTYVVPIEANNINLALAHTDVTEVLVRDPAPKFGPVQVGTSSCLRARQ